MFIYCDLWPKMVQNLIVAWSTVRDFTIASTKHLAICSELFMILGMQCDGSPDQVSLINQNDFTSYFSYCLSLRE